MRVRALFVSDVHLGCQFSRSEELFAFLGNYEKQKPTKRQLAALRALVKRLESRGIDFEHIKGHKQMPNQATACPGRHLMEALGL